jgi:Cupin-like domain
MSTAPSVLPLHERVPIAGLGQWSTNLSIGVEQPFVIPSGVTGARIPRWTPEFIATKYPDVQVPVLLNLPKDRVPYAVRTPSDSFEMRFEDLVAKLNDGNSYNMSQVTLELFPELLTQLDLSFIKSRRILATNIWMGARTRSGLHFDSADNAFVQIYGRKRLLLIDPASSGQLYPYADVPSKSQVDPESPDLKRFPMFSQCKVMEHTLEPGDLVYIPKGWWHHLSADEISISANCWFGEPFSTSDFAKRVNVASPRVCLQLIWDFFWYGVLGRPYRQRVFSPPSLGVGLYRDLRAYCRQRFSWVNRR